MANPTTAPVPNQIVTPNVPNTGTGVQILPANPARNGLLISNISSNILWLGPPTVVFSSGTQQQGTIALPVAASIYFGGVSAAPASAGLLFIPWVWTAAMFAQAAAGATNAVTVLEF